MQEWVPIARAMRNNDASWGTIRQKLEEEGYNPGSDDNIRKSVKIYSDVISKESIEKTSDNEPASRNVGCGISDKEILEKYGYDSSKWRVSNYRNNGLSVKPLPKSISYEDIDAHFESYVPKIIPNIDYKTGSRMASIEIADLHLGKLCWHGDTGENFDSKIAKQMVKDLIGKIIYEIKNYDLEYILFVWTNDFFNSDTVNKTTTGNTPQDTDARWQKLFNTGVELLVDIIESLRRIAPVKTFYTRSNHDQMSSYYAIKYLSAWYKDCESVEVDCDAYPRKYMLYGNTLLGFSHGDKETASRLQSLMPTEAPELWGKSKTREFHIAHLHCEKKSEDADSAGMIIRTIASPTYSDTWHIENGYVGAVKKIQTFIYDKDDGLVNIINTPVKSYKKIDDYDSSDWGF